MYKKYVQIIWLVKELKIKSGNSISFKYKLRKKLIDIAGKKRANNWIKEYFLTKSIKNKYAELDLLVIELFDHPSNEFFLVLPHIQKDKNFKLRYVNITDQIIDT